MTTSPAPLVIFLGHGSGQGLLNNLADWLVALTRRAGDEFRVVGLSEPQEQEEGLFDRLRGLTDLRIVRSLSDPVVTDLWSQASVVHCHGFQHLSEVRRIRGRVGASFRCVLSIHYFHNGTLWKVPFSNFISGTLLNHAADMLHFLSMRSQTEFTDANALLRRSLPYFIFPLGCDEKEFAQNGSAGQPSAWDYRTILTGGRPNLVYLANFSKNKQHRWLIDALEDSLLKHHAVLWLLGEGPERGTIQGLIRKRSMEEHIICPGRIPRRHVPWLLSHMQVALCPSLSENSPHAIMEPLFAGVPVVTFDVGTAIQLVSDFSRGFVLGRPRTKIEFARKVEIILSDPLLQRRMAADARQFAARYYTWDECARKSLEMYRTLLDS